MPLGVENELEPQKSRNEILGGVYTTAKMNFLSLTHFFFKFQDKFRSKKKKDLWSVVFRESTY